MPSALAFAVESFAGRSLTGRTATRRYGSRCDAASRTTAAVATASSSSAGLRRDDADVIPVHGEGGVARRRLRSAAEPHEPGVRRRAADPQRGRPAGREGEQLREPLRLDEPPLLAELERDGPGEDDARLPRGRREGGSADPRRLDAQRQLDLAHRPGQRRERRHDRVGGGGAVEDASGPGGNDDDARLAEGERGAAAPPVDGLGDLVQLVGERSVEDPRRRRHVGAEEVDVDAPEAAKGPEAAALALSGVDGGLPVRLDAEGGRADPEPLACGDEDDRLAGESGGPALEQRPRVRRLEPADVDPVDADAFGDLRRRSREDEPQHDAGADDHGEEQEHPAAERRPLRTRRPTAAAAVQRGRLRLPAHHGDGSPSPSPRQGGVPHFDDALTRTGPGV